MTKPKLINLYDIFGQDEDEDHNQKAGVTEIELSKLKPFKNHPFKLYEGDRLNDMVESIKEHGVITPLIVRPLDDKYEILSGHNRANAAKLAGLEKVTVVIKEGLTDEEAMLIVTETNVIQRSFSELSHSEKARVLAERHKAIKQQGIRTDLIKEIEILSKADDLQENSTSYQFDKKLNSNKTLGEKYNLSSATISRYLRIDTLIDELKERLDNGEIPFMAAFDLSFLSHDEQEIVENILESYDVKVDIKKSITLKTLAQGRKFNYNIAYEVLSGKYFEKPKKNKRIKFTSQFTKRIVEKYVTEERSIDDLEKLIEELLDDYFSKQ